MFGAVSVRPTTSGSLLWGSWCGGCWCRNTDWWQEVDPPLEPVICASQQQASRVQRLTKDDRVLHSLSGVSPLTFFCSSLEP